MKLTLTALTAAIALALSHSVLAAPVANTNITEAKVQAAQEAWGAALINISQTFEANGFDAAREAAESVLNQAYAFGHGPVLFKPTLTHGETTFRTTHEGALAYFVGGNPNFPDEGFALKNWTGYEFTNAAVFINGDMALTTGNVTLTNANGDQTTVDKTWGFRLNDDGQVRIVLHHSSLPFSG